MGRGILIGVCVSLFFVPNFTWSQTIDPPSVPTATNPKDHFDNAERLFYREVAWWQNKSDDYRDAASEYRMFIELYVTSPDVNLELLFRGKFQLAESYFRFNQSPDRSSD
jgi:hypothetical protein